MGNSANGRVVLNHSTHLPGLIPLLEKLCQHDGIQTITPGVISTTRSRSPRFTLKISVPIRGGFKLIGRQGKTVQEIFVLTTLAQDELQAAIADVLNR